MTLPITTTLPIHSEKIIEGGKNLDKYMKELIFTLQKQYEEVAQAVNGTIRSDSEQGGKKYTPELDGSITGTFTYVHQVGWVLRRGLFVDVWGDISWNGVGTAAGDLFVKLPYKVAVSSEMPFVGVVQDSSITYTAGTSLVMNCQPDTYNGEIFYVGNGVASSNQSVVASGRIIFHCRYLGQGIER